MRVRLKDIRNLFWLWAICACMCMPSAAQGFQNPGSYLEAGAGINLSYFDIGGGSPGMSLGAGALFDLHPNWRIGPAISLHRTRGTDEGTPNAGREYSYRSNLLEISFRGMYLFRFDSFPVREWKRRLEPRIFAGLGIVQVQSIQNSTLAGQNESEGISIAPLFSGGIGLAWHLERDISVLLEAASNLTTSDLLEGYTNLRHSSSTDMFHSMLLKVIYRIPKVSY